MSLESALHLWQSWHAAYQPRAYFLALSGGRDSMALLALLADFRAQSALHDLPFHALYIDHGWHEQSALWGEFCLEQAKRFGLTAEVLRLNLPNHTGESREAQAREARYQALAERLPERAVLLTAHHQDDQVETFFLQLTRGAGLDGLAAMPATKRFGRGELWRPLLGVSHETIETFVRERGVPFLDDPSNDDLRFERNRWRKALLPALREHFPHLNAAVSRSVGHLQSALSYQQRCWQQTIVAHQSALSAEERERGAVFRLEKHDAEEQSLLREIIKQHAPPPPQKRFEAFWRGLGGRGHSELHWGNVALGQWVVVEHRGRLYLHRHHVPSAPPLVGWRNHWHGIGDLLINNLPAGCGLDDCRWGLYPAKALFHERGRAYPADLKNVLQNHGYSPYVRRRLPLLFLGNQLAWIGGIGTAQGLDELRVDWREKALSVKISAYQLPKS